MQSPRRLFQARLAVKLGVPNIDALADSLTDEQVLEWQAVALIDGWAHGWQQTAEILAAIQNQTNRVVLSNSADPKKLQARLDWTSGKQVTDELTAFAKPKKSMLSVRKAQEILKQ